MSYLDSPHPVADNRRVYVLMALVALGLLAIIARLWYLQVALGPELTRAAESNHTRRLRRLPPRGRIEDRNGRVLGSNREEIVVSVSPAEVKKSPTLLPLLAELLKIPLEDLADSIDRNRTAAQDPVPIAADVDVQTVTRLEERRLDLPGVVVEPEPIRYYPDGPLFGHALGQMGQAFAADLKRDPRYRPGDFCGKLGVERAYDAVLRGTDGGRDMEVDSRGALRRMVAEVQPIPGATLRLTLDTAVQRAGYDGLREWTARGDPGAAVALDPRTGAVLALVSLPSYDPNRFATGITARDWNALRKNPLKPLIDRAVSSGYAPGSTFKVITTCAGLESRKIMPSTEFTCSGGLRLGSWLKRCWNHSGHGTLDLTEAIARSCDVYFYHAGELLGPNVLAKYARRFGLGRPTGIDIALPQDPRVEAAGIVPDPEWKKAHHRGPWVGGDTVDYAIGQSMLKCTPIQMCEVAAAIANGGTLYRPQLVQRITTYDRYGQERVARMLQPVPAGRLGISASTRQEVVRGMVAAMQPGGTGAHCALPGVEIAGKTGTAEMVRAGKVVNNAWFIGFAPVQKPRIAVCVFVEGGGHGGTAAAPIARRMIAAYLRIPLAQQESGAAFGD